MSVSVSVNGVSYTIPQTSEVGWGTNVTSWIQAVSNSTLQKSGGVFTLTADVDFGASYGLKALYLKSQTSNIADAGTIRLANSDSIRFRNAANSANLSLAPGAADILTWGGVEVLQSGHALSKLAALTASRALVSDVSGVISASAVTAVELGYLSGVSSGLQTQLDSKDSVSSVNARFHSSTGHDHDGTDSKKILGTNIDSALEVSGKVLTANGSGGAAWVTPASSPDQSYEINNLAIAASVASNALTVAIKTKAGADPSGSDVVKIGFRSASATSGVYAQRSISSALSLTISSGSTLGHTNGKDEYIYIYAIDNSGTIELAVAGSQVADEGSLISTTAEGGAGAADSKTTLYSATARTNVPVRLVGRIKSSQVNAGTWALAPSELSVAPLGGKAVRSTVSVHGGNGHGSTANKIRRFTTVWKNTGSAVTYADSATDGSSFTVNEDGIYAIEFADYINNSGGSNHGISVNASSLITAIGSVSDTQRLSFVAGGGSGADSYSSVAVATVPLLVGDVVRPHTNGVSTTTGNQVWFRITKIAD